MWTKLDTRTLILIPEGEEPPPPPEEWVKLDTRAVTLTPPGVAPPEEGKFPWAPVLIGGGALIAVVGLASTKKG